VDGGGCRVVMWGCGGHGETKCVLYVELLGLVFPVVWESL